MANRTTVKSNIQALNVPSVTNADLEDMLNDNICDNVVFKEDVGAVQTSTSTSITCDFTGKDRINLTRIGGALVIAVSNILDGQVVYLDITKTAGQSVSFSGVTDVTAFPEEVTSKSSVLYRITRKGSSYYAEAVIKDVSFASITEARTGTSTTKVINPDTLNYVARPKAVVVTSNYTVADNVGSVFINSGSNNVTVTLPSASTFGGHKIYVACEGTTSNSYVNGSGLPGGSPSAALSSNHMYVCVSNGSEWFKTDLGQMDNAEGLACPFVYVNGKFFDEILKNIIDVDGEETIDISSVLHSGENLLTISEEKQEITYMKKLYFNGDLIAENIILHEGDKFNIRINHNKDIALLTAKGHYVNV